MPFQTKELNLKPTNMMTKLLTKQKQRSSTNIINICKKYIQRETCWVLLFSYYAYSCYIFLDIEPTTNILLS